MEPAVTSGARIGDRPRPKKNYLNETKGFKSWALTVDHKRIGIMYLVGTLTAFLLGGIFALLVRLTLLTPAHKTVRLAGHRGNLQPLLHPARRDHGVSVHHSLDSRLAYQFRTYPSCWAPRTWRFPG